MVSIPEVFVLGSVFPVLEHLEIGYNHLVSLEWPSADRVFARLTTLSLEGNSISDWPSLLRATRALVLLERLVLTDNAIGDIPSPTLSDLHPAPSGLRNLSLINNKLHSWNSIDSLSAWLPLLESLSVQGNPLVDDPHNEGLVRPLMISRLPGLRVWNGSTVSPSDRRDCELFYLSFIARIVVSEEDRVKEHPRWVPLCSQYGTPELEQPSGPDNLGSRLIELYVHRLLSVPPLDCTTESLPSDKRAPAPSVKVLPSMALKTLRIKALKALKESPRLDAAVKLYAIYHAPGGEQRPGFLAVREMDLEVDGRKGIDHWLDNGNGVGVLIQPGK